MRETELKMNHSMNSSNEVDDSSDLAQLLNKQLANTVDLRSRARQAHFNVKGPYAEELGSLFDGLARELREFADLIAQRISALGGLPAATVRFVARESSLRDYPLDALNAYDHLHALLSSYSRYEWFTRHNMKTTQHIGDSETEQLLKRISAAIEKNLWFLEAYLEGVAVGLHGRKMPKWTSAFQGRRNIDRNESSALSGAA